MLLKTVKSMSTSLDVNKDYRYVLGVTLSVLAPTPLLPPVRSFKQLRAHAHLEAITKALRASDHQPGLRNFSWGQQLLWAKRFAAPQGFFHCFPPVLLDALNDSSAMLDAYHTDTHRHAMLCSAQHRPSSLTA